MKQYLYRDDEPFYLVLVWGVTTALAAALTQLEASIFLALPGTAEVRVMVYWTVLMALPIAGTIYEYRDLAMKTHLNVIWAVLVGIGVLLNWPGPFMDVGTQLAIYGYYHKWFLIGALGFAVSAWKLRKESRTIYVAATIGNLAVLATLGHPIVFQYAYGLAVIVQGLPMIGDWYVNR